MNYSGYNKTIIAILIAGAVSVAIFNFVVDPADYFGYMYIDGFNREKTTLEVQGGRMAKASAIQRRNYKTVIIGSSRAQLGLNPDSRVFEPGTAYNLALFGTNMFEIDKVFEYLVKKKKPEVIILGLDFLTFSNKRIATGDYDSSDFSMKPRTELIFDYLFSMTYAKYSFQTVADNMDGIKSLARPNGFMDYLFNKRSPHEHFIKFIRMFSINPDTYADFEYGIDRLKMFEDILEGCRKNDIDLKLFISPVHADQIETMRAVGLYELFERWKRDLVRVVAANNDKYSKSEKYILWDFSGYNTYTTETVSRKKKEKMKWYFDSSHYNSALGDIVLDIIVGGDPTRSAAYGDFGIALDDDNIESHLTDTRNKREDYIRSHPEDIADINRMYNATKRFRRKNPD